MWLYIQHVTVHADPSPVQPPNILLLGPLGFFHSMSGGPIACTVIHSHCPAIALICRPCVCSHYDYRLADISASNRHALTRMAYDMQPSLCHCTYTLHIYLFTEQQLCASQCPWLRCSCCGCLLICHSAGTLLSCWPLLRCMFHLCVFDYGSWCCACYMQLLHSRRTLAVLDWIVQQQCQDPRFFI